MVRIGGLVVQVRMGLVMQVAEEAPGLTMGSNEAQSGFSGASPSPPDFCRAGKVRQGKARTSSVMQTAGPTAWVE